ncbi:MAG: ACP S-malonyltransferase [Deltaproteobacteria bacterium]|nr:ACP S-malonyltransferase [Deltaproteobacteria bacterium]
MMTLAIFPGQGSQYVGMAGWLKDNFPRTRQIFEEASEAIKLDLLELCLEGPESTLQLTFNAQPCILVTSFACYSSLKEEFGFQPAAGAGHSLGEYTALLAAGAIQLSDAVRLVRRRGELMQDAVPEGQGKMAAVIGLADEAVKSLCAAATHDENSLVVPANYNAPNQVVIAGHTTAVERAEKLAADKSNPTFYARKVIPLKVSAPFHCPLMKKVAEGFEPYLTAVQWKKPCFPIAFNVDGTVRSSAELPLLKQQIDHPVLWTACVNSLSKLASVFIEPAPGRVLSGLVKRILDDCKTCNVDNIEDFKLAGKVITGREDP